MCIIEQMLINITLYYNSNQQLFYKIVCSLMMGQWGRSMYEIVFYGIV
jgi:hypothetical protein